jgi:hypothetical protein
VCILAAKKKKTSPKKKKFEFKEIFDYSIEIDPNQPRR